MQVQIRTFPTIFGDIVRGAVAAFLFVGIWLVTEYLKSTMFGGQNHIDWWLAFMAAWNGAFIALRIDRNAGKLVSK